MLLIQSKPQSKWQDRTKMRHKEETSPPSSSPVISQPTCACVPSQCTGGHTYMCAWGGRGATSHPVNSGTSTLNAQSFDQGTVIHRQEEGDALGAVIDNEKQGWWSAVLGTNWLKESSTTKSTESSTKGSDRIKLY